MYIHEYLAKDLLRKYGVKTLSGNVVKSASAAVNAAKELGGDSWAIKAQICVGDRAKSGGVRFATSLEEVEEYSNDILDLSLITTENGVINRKVEKLLIEPKLNFDKEYFVAYALDRRVGRVIVLASNEGGVNLEERVINGESNVIAAEIDPATGYSRYIGRKIGYGLGLDDSQIPKLSNLLESLYKLYDEKDCLGVELNPFVVDADGDFVALDAKIAFDDNALFRQPEIARLKDCSADIHCDDVRKGYSYLELDGDIGFLVNGAGLAMATMDSIKRRGGEPANFIDLNGNATVESVEKAFGQLLENSSIRAIVINIFGGIMKCDIVSAGILNAAKKRDLNMPLIVRMEGTHVALAKKQLKDSEIEFIFASTLEDAAIKLMEALEGAQG